MKLQGKVESSFTPQDIEIIWERYFGKRHSLSHIARDYSAQDSQIAQVIDTESARRWHSQHPEETNRRVLQ